MYLKARHYEADIAKAHSKTWGYYGHYDRLRIFNMRDSEDEAMFECVMKAYCFRKKDVTPDTILTRDTNGYTRYWYDYMTANQCRDVAKFIRHRVENKLAYIADKEYVLYERYGYKEVSKNTLLMPKNKFSESKLFLEALDGAGTRQINMREKRFLLALARFLESCRGYWKE